MVANIILSCLENFFLQMKYYPKVKEIQLKYKKIIAKFTFTLLTTSFTAMGSSGVTPQSSCFSMVYI